MNAIQLKLIVEDSSGNTIAVIDCISHFQLEAEIENIHQTHNVLSVKTLTVATVQVEQTSNLASVPAASQIGPEDVMEVEEIYNEVEILMEEPVEEYPEEEVEEEKEEE